MNRFRAYDWLTIGYIVVWVFLIAFFFSRIQYAGLFLSFHIVAVLLSLLLAGLQPEFSLLKIVQRWYPVFLLPLFFMELHYLIPAIRPGDFDSLLIKLDFLLTGTYPTVWMEHFYYTWLTEILQLSYSTFYFLPLLVLIPLYKRKDTQKFDRVGFMILLSFYLSYLGYLILPALGPRYYLANLQTVPLDGNGIFYTINSTLNGLENIQWDAFPSGHVAVALVFAYFAFKFVRKTFYLMFPVVVMLIISTVYLRYHYAIDVFSGFLLFGIVILVDKMMYKSPSPSK
ncbi:MAG: phosphatase PAP2 family protein [Calditrichia bacterium]